MIPAPLGWWRRALALGVALVLAALMATWRERLLVEPGARRSLDRGAPVLAGFWHDSIPIGLAAGRRLGLSALVSTSRDGLLTAAVLRRLGIGVVAGSSGSTERGAWGLLRAGRALAGGAGPLALALDGSRGPRRVAREGILVLALHAGAAVVPVGCACGRSWRLRSWDRTRIPWPFARVAVVVGEPVELERPEELGRALDAAEARAVEALGL